MKKVALIYFTSMNSPTGASAVMRSFYNGKEEFKNNGIDLSIYSPGLYNTSEEISVQKDNDKGFYKMCSGIIRKYAKNNTLAALITITIPYLRSSIVKSYLSSNNSEDVVFIHDLLTCYKYIKLRKNKKVKIILVLHSDGDTFSMWKEAYKTLEKSFIYKYLLRIERKVLKNIDKLGFVANYPSQIFLNIHPEFDKNKVFYVYNGLTLGDSKIEITKKPTKTYEICCVGTVSERKGQRFIVEALHKMSKDSIVPNVHFSVIGGGNIKNELEALSAQYGISEYITFLGSCTNVNEYLINSNIFILPSLVEGFPIAILEAMRAKLPIVSTKVAGIPEMMEQNVTGIFIEPSADGVFNFLRNIDNYDWNKMGGKSYEFFLEKFTVEKMIKSYSKIMKTI